MGFQMLSLVLDVLAGLVAGSCLLRLELIGDMLSPPSPAQPG